MSTTGKHYIRLDAKNPQLLIPVAEQYGLDWEITVCPKTPRDKLGMVIRLDAFICPAPTCQLIQWI
ncbi:MAG: hypothetical protein ACYC64_11700 [Armatimonadota bacterium]